MMTKITNQRLFKLLLADIIISALVAVGFAFTGWYIYRIANKASTNSSQIKVANIAAYQACLKINAQAQADAKRWAAILKLIDRPSNMKNPAVIKFVAGVAAANAAADKTVVCVRPKGDP